MSAKSGNCLLTVPFLGLPVLGVILIILISINAVNKFQRIFMTNGKKATVETGGIGDEQ